MSTSRFISQAPLRHSVLAAAALLLATSAVGATLSVGPGKQFSMPCHAFGAAGNGDVVEIDAAGTYSGDVCGIYANNLTIRGVNGRPKIDAAGRNSQGKGTWVVGGTNTTIENVEMYGAKVPDQNGAAVRLDGRDLTLRNVYFHHNENGILTNNDGVTNLVVENSEFAFNGYGTGYTHNLYVGHINSLVFRGSYSHDANVGHNLKSRANVNTIVYSRFSSTGGGQPSYEIDLPNAGTAYVIGNVIHQPASNQNPGMLTYGVEGASNTGRDLYVVNNTFINDDSSRGTFIMVGGDVTTPVLMQNNLFVGTGSSITQSNATDKTNYRTVSPSFVDRANFDLRPAAGFAVINAGSAAGSTTSGLSLVASKQYKHTATTEDRPVSGAIDIGAYEAGTAVTTDTQTAAPTPAAPAPVTTSPAPTTTDTSWKVCAAEGGTCNFSGTRQVRYGIEGKYAYKSLTGPVGCDNGTFGDPAYGSTKSCAYAETATTSTTPAPTPTPTPTSPTPTTTTSGWVNCASEGGTCYFSGSAQVRYGIEGKYAYQTLTGPVSCSNGVFGDPAYGYAKSCAYVPAAPTTTWTGCASEGGYCSVSGTRQVRYGVAGSYAYKTVTGGVACSNGVFGDPAYGYAKTCEFAN